MSEIPNPLQRAQAYARLLKDGIVKNRADLARREGISRARVTQFLNLTRLAPRIMSYFNRHSELLNVFTERQLRDIICLRSPLAQYRRFCQLVRHLYPAEYQKNKLWEP